jgi:glutaconate CoA-transferase subunit B
LPGAGGAPEIATSSREILITLRHSQRNFRDRLDFVTSAGHLEGGDSRQRLGLPGKGPIAVITDMGILTPEPLTKELILTSIHGGVEIRDVMEATGWPLKVSGNLTRTDPPTNRELSVLRDLLDRTARTHSADT